MAPKFIDIQKSILRNAVCAAEAFIEKGYRLVSGGTDNHMVLLDLRSKDHTGKQAEDILESVGIVVNRNVIPYDPESTMTTSGLRLGFSVAAARGMGPPEVRQIVELIDSALTWPDRTENLEKIAGAVKTLCKRFPYYSSESEAV